MQRTERLPLLFPRALVGVAAGKERGISLWFLFSLLLSPEMSESVLVPAKFEFEAS